MTDNSDRDTGRRAKHSKIDLSSLLTKDEEPQEDVKPQTNTQDNNSSINSKRRKLIPDQNNTPYNVVPPSYVRPLNTYHLPHQPVYYHQPYYAPAPGPPAPPQVPPQAPPPSLQHQYYQVAPTYMPPPPPPQQQQHADGGYLPPIEVIAAPPLINKRNLVKRRRSTNSSWAPQDDLRLLDLVLFTLPKQDYAKYADVLGKRDGQSVRYRWSSILRRFKEELRDGKLNGRYGSSVSKIDEKDEEDGEEEEDDDDDEEEEEEEEEVEEVGR